ncbi:MAG: hypothetical protein V1793_02630 [Pseudomonadota bacterium]
MGTDGLLGTPVLRNRPVIRKIGIGGLALILAACIQGCGSVPVYGLIYTHVRVPYTIDLDNTPNLDPVHGQGAQVTMSEPLSGYGLSARTRSNAMGDAAGAGNMGTLNFADQEIFSLFGGIYRTTTIHVYGDRNP